MPVASGRDRGEIVAPDQTVHIQSGAAGDDGGLAPGENVVHNGGGHFGVAADGKILPGVADIDHMVTDALHFRGVRLGGADVHAPVDIHGVAGNHFAVGGLGQLYRQGGLAGGCGPGDANNAIQNGRLPSF